MAVTTSISWTGSTWNPWQGCTKVSPGCANCYAETLLDHRYHRVRWGKGNPRLKTKTWRDPIKWNASQPKGHRVFVASLADIFDAEVDPAWLGEVLDLMAKCQNLRFLVLTKRVEEAAKRLPTLVAARGGWTNFSHLWLGCTAENQAMWDLRVPILMGIPGVAKTFVSVEPQLGPIDPVPLGLKPGWIIVGGESGRHHRDLLPDWPIPLRNFAACNGIPFFFKQWGGVRPKEQGKLLQGIEWCQTPQP